MTVTEVPDLVASEEAALVARIAGGDRDIPVAELYERYAPRLFRFGVRALQDHGLAEEAKVLATDEVAVVDLEYGDAKELHAKYHIEGVPIVVIADQSGVVRKHFIGPVTATDLWAASAEARAGD